MPRKERLLIEFMHFSVTRNGQHVAIVAKGMRFAPALHHQKGSSYTLLNLVS